MPTFVPGLELSRKFYVDGVQPVLREHFPDLLHSAALIGSGSEVLGYDTEMSSDHHWGPRVLLFLREYDYKKHKDPVKEALRHHLPYEIAGYPTNFGEPNYSEDDHGTQLLESIQEGPINHRAEIYTIRDFFQRYLNVDVMRPIGVLTWLTIPSQRLLAVTAGAVFHDGLGLEAVRRRFTYYPHDVWLYQMAAVWNRIGQEEHLMPRAGHVGDELGSAIIAARLVRDVMQLCFLMEKRYAPYAKWFGTAFKTLACADEMGPVLEAALTAETWQQRETHLCVAYEMLARMHNDLELTDTLPTDVEDFHGRPFKVIQGWRFAEALVDQITDPVLKEIVTHNRMGGIDMVTDNTDLLENSHQWPVLRRLYQMHS